MCPSTDHNTRRRIRPHAAEPECQRRKELPHTSSTSASSKSDSFRAPPDARVQEIQELQRKLCPITGILRDISADYRIFSTVLGKGHYGVVRECIHRSSREIFAVKSVDKSKIRRPDHLRREVDLLYKMNHRGVMRMVEVYEDARYVHIVTERYTGGELFDKIGASTTPEGCLSEQTAAGIIKSLLEAVAYLHDNEIVHRDIKPENILFESTREGSPIKLIDFGLSRRHKRDDAPMNNPVGTAYYMAPELLEGRYDKACDVWSVGTIAYIMLCGYPPFNGETDPDIFDAIQRGHYHFPDPAWASKSDGAKKFVNYLMMRDPRRRPAAREALEHTWIMRNCCSNDRSASADDAKQEQQQDIVAKIQTLRMTIQRFKHKHMFHLRLEEVR
eukprot:CAMPEP_0172543476 /NCGR_PEP_ID=MMETSP1067-20121228/13864_1 /TAXON_ID=265564 ORGANISM="Thalassiosira punctigera, Strain Tpunct2005C2" /NCGR_SAMPLE_ID=MMETSP1067 /ASSEMBLY_ACC=CAM_ASM_000444 /LENGTH=387 /DNA_ID=CAMNT_0013329901 /DNA_START=82 /DNA_END=1245 /DNA_ORIENTATION=-